MYLAGKLSKFEIADWIGRQPRHIRWWDMFVEDISLEILEDTCHQVLDLYSQQPSRTDSPQGLNTLPAKTLPTLPASTPTKSSIGRGFDQRLDAMQPKVEVSASANYVNYAMGVTPPVVAGLPPNIGVVPGVAPISVAPHSIPPGHAFPFSAYPIITPSSNPPVPPTPPQAYPPPPPSQPAAFYAPYTNFSTGVYPPTPTTAQQPPPPPRPY